MRLPLLILHILGGSISLIAGTVAMIARKGDRIHRFSGNVFTAAMLTLATSALWLAILKSQVSNVIAAVLTFYLIASAWLAGRRREGTSLLDYAGLVACVTSAAGVLTLGFRAILSGKGTDNGAPAAMSFIFGGILLFAACGDVRMLVSGGISGRPRIIRHLWRMCFGLFIATGSFFLGQPQVFPASLRGSIYLIVPALLPLPLMIFWLFRVRFRNAYRIQLQRHPHDRLHSTRWQSRSFRAGKGNLIRTASEPLKSEGDYCVATRFSRCSSPTHHACSLQRLGRKHQLQILLFETPREIRSPRSSTRLARYL